MKETRAQKLAASLTANSEELIPFLPYLLQDFRELGSDPQVMVDILKQNASGIHSVLDLCCGKGTVGIALAKEFGCRVKGVDIMEQFIEEAKLAAEQQGVLPQCNFVVQDVARAVKKERGYDCVVWGAAGNILGTYRETLQQIQQPLANGGYLLIDDSYVDSQEANEVMKFHAKYPTYDEWLSMFFGLQLRLVDYMEFTADVEQDGTELGNIKKRVEELCKQYPDKKEMLRGYVQSQRDEYEDLQMRATGVVWLVQKDA